MTIFEKILARNVMYPVTPHIREHKQPVQMERSSFTITNSSYASDSAHLNHFWNSSKL